jgi:opacity protein-like surface antigen
MRKTRLVFPLVVVLLLAAAPAWAQRAGRVSVAADVGVIWPRFDRPDVARFHTVPDLIYGGHFAYGVSDHVGLQFGLTRCQQNVDVGGHEPNAMVIQEFYGLFNWNIPLGVLQPYVLLGLGYYMIGLDPPLADENDFGLIFGVGVDALLTDSISFGVVARYDYLFAHEFDYARTVIGLANVAFAF